MASSFAQTQDTSDEEHFSDASEGQQSDASRSPRSGLETANDRSGARNGPGEIQTVSNEGNTLNPSLDSSKPAETMADIFPVPSTLVEKVDLDSSSHGEVPWTAAYEVRKGDAEPDDVQQTPYATHQSLDGSPTSPRYRSSEFRRRSSNLTQRKQSHSKIIYGSESFVEGTQGSTEETTEPAGDEFDDFEQGDDEDDFGAFDDGFQEKSDIDPVSYTALSHHAQTALPLLDLSDLDSLEEISSACESFLDELFPNRTQSETADSDAFSELYPNFLTERSKSLWDQLVALPPLQPPNWVRSRIRRLFLVSLSVPVDLDEILPASKQKKLVLPSIEIESERSLSIGSEDVRPNGNLAAPKQAEGSSTSINSTVSKGERKRRGRPPPPEFDLNSARLLCSTTDVALNNFTVEELRDHVLRLEGLKQRANELLEYWLIQRDAANSDKDAFEEVIENLVKHARKIRK